MVQEFSAFFPVEVITRMLGVPEDRRQQVRQRVDTSLHREPGQIEMSEDGMQAVAARTVSMSDWTTSRLPGFATLLCGAGAETVTKLIGTAAVTFARFPDQWQKLRDDRSKIAAPALTPPQRNVRSRR